jgi:hypothetical protein
LAWENRSVVSYVFSVMIETRLSSIRLHWYYKVPGLIYSVLLYQHRKSYDHLGLLLPNRIPSGVGVSQNYLYFRILAGGRADDADDGDRTFRITSGTSTGRLLFHGERTAGVAAFMHEAVLLGWYTNLFERNVLVRKLENHKIYRNKRKVMIYHMGRPLVPLCGHCNI